MKLAWAISAVLLSAALAGCADQQQIAAQQRWAELHKQRDAAEGVCEARFPGDDYNPKTIVAKFKCINQADAIQLSAVPDPDLAQSYMAFRVMIAEQLQNGQITAAQAAAMIAEKRYQLNSEGQRRNAVAQTAAAQQRAADAAAAEADWQAFGNAVAAANAALAAPQQQTVRVQTSCRRLLNTIYCD
jgi:hypothetical protein